MEQELIDLREQVRYLQAQNEELMRAPPPVAVFLTNLTLLQIMLHLQCLLTGYFMCLGRGNAHIFMGIWTPF